MNQETRKLTLYSRDDKFDSVDAVTCLAFFAQANIPVNTKRDVQENAEARAWDQRQWMKSHWPVVLERKSTLRRHPTQVAGAFHILRFIYQTEVTDYEWYPQNPLDRA